MLLYEFEQDRIKKKKKAVIAFALRTVTVISTDNRTMILSLPSAVEPSYGLE